MDLNKLKSNFKAFDFLLADDTAISAKTLDTRGKSYQKPSKITATLNKYVDQMVNFQKDGVGKKQIFNSDFKKKEMHLAVPSETTKAQMKAIEKSMEYARSHNIEIIVTKVK